MLHNDDKVLGTNSTVSVKKRKVRSKSVYIVVRDENCLFVPKSQYTTRGTSSVQ